MRWRQSASTAANASNMDTPRLARLILDQARILLGLQGDGLASGQGQQ